MQWKWGGEGGGGRVRWTGQLFSKIRWQEGCVFIIPQLSRWTSCSPSPSPILKPTERITAVLESKSGRGRTRSLPQRSVDFAFIDCRQVFWLLVCFPFYGILPVSGPELPEPSKAPGREGRSHQPGGKSLLRLCPGLPVTHRVS